MWRERTRRRGSCAKSMGGSEYMQTTRQGTCTDKTQKLAFTFIGIVAIDEAILAYETFASFSIFHGCCSDEHSKNDRLKTMSTNCSA